MRQAITLKVTKVFYLLTRQNISPDFCLMVFKHHRILPSFYGVRSVTLSGAVQIKFQEVNSEDLGILHIT